MFQLEKKNSATLISASQDLSRWCHLTYFPKPKPKPEKSTKIDPGYLIDWENGLIFQSLVVQGQIEGNLAQSRTFNINLTVFD